MSDLAFSSPGEFLALFGVDAERGGAADFCQLAGRIVLLHSFPPVRCSGYSLAVFEMRCRHISPLVYWSNMRRALAPVFDSGREALNELLGVEVRGEGDMTVYDVAEALARALLPAAPRDEAHKKAAELLAAAVKERQRKK